MVIVLSKLIFQKEDRQEEQVNQAQYEVDNEESSHIGDKVRRAVPHQIELFADWLLRFAKIEEKEDLFRGKDIKRSNPSQFAQKELSIDRIIYVNQ